MVNTGSPPDGENHRIGGGFMREPVKFQQTSVQTGFAFFTGNGHSFRGCHSILKQAQRDILWPREVDSRECVGGVTLRASLACLIDRR